MRDRRLRGSVRCPAVEHLPILCRNHRELGADRLISALSGELGKTVSLSAEKFGAVHDAPPFCTGGSATGLSAAGAWVEPQPAMAIVYAANGRRSQDCIGQCQFMTALLLRSRCASTPS